MTIASDLKRSYIFQGISPAEVEKASVGVRQVTYEPGEYICRKGESEKSFYIVAQGKVELLSQERGAAACVYGHISAGGHFGEVSLLTGRPSFLSVRAITSVRVLVFEREVFESCIMANPLIHRALDRALAERLVAASSEGHYLDDNLREYLEPAHGGHNRLRSRAQMEQKRSAAETGGESDLNEGIDLTKKIRHQLQFLAVDRSPVLVTGEPGTARLLAAKQIHLYSEQKSEPYVEFDLLNYDQWIWEGKLFGYERDSFPYSPGRQLGLFEQLTDGTLVINHAEELDKGLQKKLCDTVAKGRFTTADGKGEQPFKVRLVFITESDLETLERESVLIPEMIELFSGRVMSLPPLREHKRDIPALVEYYLKQYSSMHNKKVTSVSPDALGLLMKYDWPGNLTELSNVIHRAVMVSQQDEIISEQILLGLPRTEGRLVYNLLRLPRIRRLIENRLYPILPKVIVNIIFGIGIVTLFFGPQDPEKNLGLTLSWYVGWPLLIISFFFLPRFWCSVCALSAPGKFVQKIIQPTRRLPALITANSSWIMAILCLIVFWVEVVWNAYANPWLTGMILLTITSGALLFSLLFERYSWCRYVCPLGGLNAIFSMPSILELRANRQMCENKCTDHACYKGTAETPGCPMFRHPFLVDNNKDCILCGRCVKNCRYHSTQLNLRLAPRELWSIQSPQMADSFLVVSLGAIYFLLAGHQEFTAIIHNSSFFVSETGQMNSALAGSFIFWGVIAIAWSGYSVLCRIQALVISEDHHRVVSAFGYGLIPVVLGGFLAFYIEMFFQGAWRLVPNFLLIFGVETAAEEFHFISEQGISTVLHISILGGIFASLYSTYKIFKRMDVLPVTSLRLLALPFFFILALGIAYLTTI